MTKTIKVLLLLFVAALPFCFLTSCSDDNDEVGSVYVTDTSEYKYFEVDGIEYCGNYPEEGQASVWRNLKSSTESAYTGSIIIPETVEYDGVTYTVVSIGPSAFSGSTITDIVLPKTVTTFERGAFGYCYNLTEFVVPDHIETIEYGAFEYCVNLNNVIIGSGVETIGDYAFAYCYSLTDVTIGSGVKTIGVHAFSEYPQSYWEDTFGTGRSAVGTSGSLKNVEWKGVVDSLGNGAFYYCEGLKEMSIPCKYIGSYAFSNCTNLMEVTLESTVESMGDNVFVGCTNLMQATIASKSVGAYAFSKCTNLIEVNFKDGVEGIGDYAFNGCSKMTDIALPNSITAIGEGAFYDSGLTTVTIPSSVHSIGNLAFYCGLKEYAVDENNNYYCAKDGILYSKDMTAIVQCPKAYEAFDAYEIPNTVGNVGEYAFYGCTKMSEMNIPESVSAIGDYAFASSKLARIAIGCNSVGDYAFNGCTNLSEVTFSDAVAGCTSLKELSLNAATTIGDYSFQSCTRLVTVDTGSAATTIGGYAFNKCSALAEVTIGAAV